ncbi:MAG: Lin1244/Lin1753 domain-containing protein [Planctomycetota bacterium]|jgi:hypothetical protein
MRWFKHFSDSLEDPFIQALMDNFGHLGYVVWFGLLETIAKENGYTLTGNLVVSPTYLRRKFRSSSAKLQEVFDFCQTFGKLSVNYSEHTWEFSVPKMLELKDNYTKNLQVTSNKLYNQKEVEVDAEVEAEEEKEGTVAVTGGKESRRERLEQKLEALPEDERGELWQKAETAVKAKYDAPFLVNDTSIHREMLNMLEGEEMAVSVVK